MAKFGQYSQSSNDTIDQHNKLVEQLNKTFAGMVDIVYPIGSIYISVLSTNPSTVFGGTWTAFSVGRTLIGINPADPKFDASEETGGNINHTHRSNVGFLGGRMYITNTGGQIGSTDNGFYTVPSTDNGASTVYGKTSEAESDVLPPYIVTYMWKRTA